ncbi:DNA (cytosine-5-)-methyltransferase [Candidatus Dojkabacteria bacterium]|nr:DNA (cytosine-5-)-methyltransferase [Candidatus Dojkabacteria bacterium]
MSNQNDTTKFKVISLFSGCGGLDLGFMGGFSYMGNKYNELPFEVVYANDIDEQACETYEHNLGHKIECKDFREVLEAKKLPDADVVLGGFPCQDFSVAGKRRGLEAKRGQLYKSMIEAVEQVQPKVFIAENVKGLLNIGKGEVIKIMEEDFAKVGYTIYINLFHTADYGVPQTRERVIIAGIRNDIDKKYSPPEPTHTDPLQKGFLDKEKKNWVTAKDVLSDLEEAKEGDMENHYWSKAKRYPGTQGNNNIKPDRPAPTMRAEHHGNIEFHYSGERRLSAREAARIQSFPDDFVFLRSTSRAYKQIGNAVPPVFGWHVAQSVRKVLE